MTSWLIWYVRQVGGSLLRCHRVSWLLTLGVEALWLMLDRWGHRLGLVLLLTHLIMRHVLLLWRLRLNRLLIRRRTPHHIVRWYRHHRPSISTHRTHRTHHRTHRSHRPHWSHWSTQKRSCWHHHWWRHCCCSNHGIGLDAMLLADRSIPYRLEGIPIARVTQKQQDKENAQ